MTLSVVLSMKIALYMFVISCYYEDNDKFDANVVVFCVFFCFCFFFLSFFFFNFYTLFSSPSDIQRVGEGHLSACLRNYSKGIFYG